MAYFTSLAGLGEWIPLGMTAGFGYATALQFESGGTALAAGIGLAVGLTMLLHASLVLTFEFYRIVADVKNNASAPPAKSGAS
ncbi:hypothetical protein DIPPA_10287 [Diplonema papillatum]|nr:hypothetical protein DIPPA_10287 [Diplonema papillatum]